MDTTNTPREMTRKDATKLTTDYSLPITSLDDQEDDIHGFEAAAMALAYVAMCVIVAVVIFGWFSGN